MMGLLSILTQEEKERRTKLNQTESRPPRPRWSPRSPRKVCPENICSQLELVLSSGFPTCKEMVIVMDTTFNTMIKLICRRTKTEHRPYPASVKLSTSAKVIIDLNRMARPDLQDIFVTERKFRRLPYI